MNARILIASDDSAAARALTDRLRGLGHTVCGAASAGVGAAERAAELRPDLALVDLDPPAGGVEAGARIGGLDVPVVYLAGDLDDDALRRARETDPFGYVVKPPDDRQLRLTLDAALARHAGDRRERERRDAERRRLSAQQERGDFLEAVVENLAAPVMVADRTGRIVLRNRALLDVFGGETRQLSDLAQVLSQYELLEADERTPLAGEHAPLSLAMKGTSADAHMFVRRRGGTDGLHIVSSGRPLVDLRGRRLGGVVVVRDISHQVRVERELSGTVASLRDQTALMESVFDSMSDALVVFGADGRSLMFNRRAQKIVGAGPDPAEFERVREARQYYYSADGSPCPQDERAAARVARGETFDDLELFRVTTSPPGRIFLSISGRPLRKADGGFRGGIVVFRDVTKDRQREARLRDLAGELAERKRAMETVFDSIGEGVVAVDEHGQFTLFNRSAEAIVGKAAANVAPREWASTYGLFRSDRTSPLPLEDMAISRAMRGQETDNAEVFVRNASRPGGTLVSINGRPLRDAGGRLKGGVITFRDVTELKEAETRLRRTTEELRQKNQFMDMVFASISDGVVVADAKGRLTVANRSAERMVGMGITDDDSADWAEVYGTFFPDEKTPFPSDRLPLVRAIQGEPTDDVHLFIRNPNMPEGVHVSVSGRPIRDAAGDLTGGVIVLHDVTRVVRSREIVTQAFAQGRLDVIDTVLHNIGNAINSVAVGVATLQEATRDDELLARFTALAGAVSAHRDDWSDWLRNDPQGRDAFPFFLALVEDLRSRNGSWSATVGRVSERVRHIVDIIRTQESFADGTVERKAVKLRPAILEAVKMLEDSLAKRGISWDVECADAPAEVLLQESKFHQMLVNLLKNAIEAIDALAGARGGDAAEPRIRVVASERKERLVIDVSDNGIGISPDRLPRIFNAGYTTKDGGSGIGLHSVANYVIAAGGSIEPLSEGVGRGTTMRVTLRLPGAPEAPRNRADA